MVEPLRHRQTKGAATDMFSLQPPRYISTLPNSDQNLQRRDWSLGAISGREQSQQNLHLFDHLIGAGEQ